MNKLLFKTHQGMVLFLALFLAVSSLAGAQGQPGERGQALDKAITTLWLEGPNDQAVSALQGIATGTHDAVWGKAIFHLSCAHLMKGARDKAKDCFGQLEKENGNPEIAKFIDPLKRILFPEPAGKDRTMNLDIQQTSIEDAIRLAAGQADRAVIIDSGLEPKKISLHLPTTDFDQVMKILGDLGNFETKKIGDILLVSPSKKNIEAMTNETGKLSIDLSDTDVREAMRFVAVKGKLNLVFHKNVRGRVSIRLADVEPLDALRMITRAADLYLDKDGDNYLVMNLSEKEKLTGKTDVATIPLRYLDPKDAILLLRGVKLTFAQATKEGNALFIKGDPEVIEKARDLLVSLDKPQLPVQISLKIWEMVKNDMKPEDFTKLSDDQKKNIARLLSSPRIITLLGRSATIEIGSNDKATDKEILDLKVDLSPVSIGDDLIKLDLRCKVRIFSEASGQKKENLREFVSTFVVKLDSPFAYEVQGGSTPTLMEVLVSKAKQ